MNEIIVLQKVRKEYQMGEETVNALRGLDLVIKKGSFTAIMGPSGSGKSTLLHMAGILDMPTTGTVSLEGKDIKKYSSKEQAQLRRHKIGFIFQRYNLMPQLTVLENVLLPMVKPDPEKAKAILDKLGLSGKYDRFQGQLSGGEQQRVVIARALANDPAIILADEPTGELDTENTRIIMDILRELNQKEGITIVVVTHNPIAAEYAESIIKMQDGVIIE
jgi:putative ABC transport system ATP-binding protein